MLLLAAAAMIGPEAVDPAQAAGKALIGCVKHAAAMTQITAANSKALEQDGLAYLNTPPEKLRSMAETSYGVGSFAWSPSVEGGVWAVGYDKGTCIVMIVGTQVEPVERRLSDLFAIPDGWTSEAIAQLDQFTRWTQYGVTMNSRHLTAQMKVQPLPTTPIKGLVMVTVFPDAEKK